MQAEYSQQAASHLFREEMGAGSFRELVSSPEEGISYYHDEYDEVGEVAVERTAVRKRERDPSLSKRLESTRPPYDKDDPAVKDMRKSIARFKSQLLQYAMKDRPFPCVRFTQGDLVPLDLGAYLPPQAATQPSRDMEELLPQRDEAQRVESILGLEVRGTQPEMTFDIFQSKFLESAKLSFGSHHALSSTPSLPFRVISDRRGLQVLYSPAYFLNPNLVFGAPTSPVDGYLRPGRYVFGLEGPDFPKRFDDALFDLPPLTEARLSL